jgi:wyosine [tRNA(Phe)-imidazoG37] synthetase (radical SAM superfamily)
VYCQVSPTPATNIEPRAFWSPEVVIEAATRYAGTLRERGECVDYLTFVPDGEPTLDTHLGEEIDGLRSFLWPSV